MSIPGDREKFLCRRDRSSAGGSLRRKRRPRLYIEVLEDRCLPALITVTSLADEAIPNDGSVSLREAISAIDGGGGTSDGGITLQNPGTFGVNDRIVFQAGLTGTIRLTAGSLTVSRPLTILGLGAASTTIDAQQHSRIFDITAAAGDVTLDGLTLTNGLSSGANPRPPVDYPFDGGAIHCLSSGTLTIRNSILSGNSTIFDTMLPPATVEAPGGGAIFTLNGAVAVTNSSLSNNQASYRGGAIYSATGAVTVTNSTLSGNSSGVTPPGGIVTGGANGGGIFSAYGPVAVLGSTLSGNSTIGDTAKGGGIFVRGGNPQFGTTALTVTNSTIDGNSTQGPNSPGGGIYARRDTPVTVTSSTVSGNFTRGANSDGGGIASDSGALTLTNSTVVDNFTQGSTSPGGGIFARSAVTLNNSTVSGNSTGAANSYGGGIFDDLSVLTLRSSIVAGNSDHGSPDLRAGGSLAITNSLIGINLGTLLTATGLTPDANGNLIGSDASPIDARLGGRLQNNGGPTQTLVLLPGSPAIDRGSNPLNLTTDQRGFPRVFGARADMGAFEVQPLVVTTGADRLDTVFDPNALSLRDAVALANVIEGGDTITFAPGLSGVPIRLSMGQLPITHGVTIQGLGAAQTVIDAQHNSRIFDVTATAGDVTLDGLTLTGGQTTAPDEPGGAIRSLSSGTLTVRNSTVSGNSTQGDNAWGGGIDAVGQVTLTSSTVSGNSTQGANARGGGIGALGVELIDSTVSGNSTHGAGANGGGIATSDNLNGGPPLGVAVETSTVTANSTTGPNADGGGIAAAVFFSLSSSIVAGNHASGSNPDLWVSGNPQLTHYVVTNSLVGNSDGTTLPPTTPGLNPDGHGNLIGSGANPIDPMLGDLLNNGGPTQTRALLASSPAIGRGANPLHLATDQRGAPFARERFGGEVDMGAYELQRLSLIVRTAADRQATPIDPNNLSLREAIALANANPGSDTITFDPGLSGMPVQLSLGQLLITDAVTIQGLGAAKTVLDAQHNSRIFDVTATGGDVTLDGLTLTGGRTTAFGEFGGAIRFLSTGTLVVRDSTVFGNSAQGRGGGIYASSGAVVLTTSTVAGNTSQGSSSDGGGVFAAGNVTVANSTVSGNSTQGRSSDGGGVEADGDLTLIDSTVSGNSVQGSDSNGSGLECFGHLSVSNSTVAGNYAPAVGVAGIDSKRGGPVTLISSIIARNRAGVGTLDLNVSGSLAVGASLIGNNQDTTLNATGPTTLDAHGNVIGSAASPIDPRLGPLADNGGPTQTMALLPDSPALGRGNNPLNLTTDQRGTGFPRPAESAIDMGAFQLQQVSLPPPPPPPQPSPPPPPPPVIQPGPSGVVLVPQKVGRTKRLVVMLSYPNGQTRALASPSQGRQWRAITATLIDLNHDGILNAVVFTARRGRRKVTRTIRL
jgi:CSLREA domain-containing protein